MQTTNENTNYLQIRSGNPGQFNVKSKPLYHGRFLIGSSENCDIVIQHPSVHAVHAILEIFPNSKKIYDLTGDGLLKVNGQAKVVAEVSLRDKLSLGEAEIILDQFYIPPNSPTVVSNPTSDLSLEGDDVLMPPQITKMPEVKREPQIESVKLPYLIYPFDKKFNFDQSEYIFEDGELVYPIFQYNVDKHSVEVMILFRKKIMSVDYITEKNGIYRLAGLSNNDNTIEYAYLASQEKIDFLEFRDNSFFLSKLDGYGMKIFSSSPNKAEDKFLKLEKQDIIQFELNDISIVIRYVDAPPAVARPPILNRNGIIWWIWAMTFIVLTIPAILFSLVDVKKEDVEKEKAPERIAKVLYKQRVQRTEKADVLKLPDEKKHEETKSTTPDPKPLKNISLNDKIPKPKVAVQKGAPPTTKQSNAPAQNQNSAKSNVKVSSASPSPKSVGHVDVYKAGQFQSTVSSLVAKGGSYQGVRAEGFGTGTGTGAQGVKGTSSGVSASTASDRIGDISGTAKGVADFGYGTKGLSKGKQFYTASIPAETVVVGLMDPDIILKILREYIPQFRYCYQREIETRQENIQGVVKLSFSIGASGNVTKAGVIEDSPIPAEVKKCVVNVLYGIQFPKLAAEGVVEVVQPFNFYPKN